MKKTSLVRFLVISFAVSILCITAGACDNGPLQYEGDPISAIGSIRWEENSGKIYLDITVTNNTNKTIKRISGNELKYTLSGNETEYYLRTSGMMSLPDIGNSKQTIKAHSSRTYSIDVWSFTGRDEEVKAYRHVLVVDNIILNGYGTLNLTDRLEFTFEGSR